MTRPTPQDVLAELELEAARYDARGKEYRSALTANDRAYAAAYRHAARLLREALEGGEGGAG